MLTPATAEEKWFEGEKNAKACHSKQHNKIKHKRMINSLSLSLPPIIKRQHKPHRLVLQTMKALCTYKTGSCYSFPPRQSFFLSNQLSVPRSQWNVFIHLPDCMCQAKVTQTALSAGLAQTASGTPEPSCQGDRLVRLMPTSISAWDGRTDWAFFSFCVILLNRKIQFQSVLSLHTH